MFEILYLVLWVCLTFILYNFGGNLLLRLICCGCLFRWVGWCVCGVCIFTFNLIVDVFINYYLYCDYS